jgi:DNA-binding beta-propeller fold protein YncE
VDGAGNVYVVDLGNCRIQVFTGGGVYLTRWGTVGTGPGQFLNPIGVAVDRGGHVYVADTNNERIQVFGQVPTPTERQSWGGVKARYRPEGTATQAQDR